MSDKKTLQSQIDKLKSVLSNPKTDGSTKKILESALAKAESKINELEKAEKLEKSKKEITPKQEKEIKETKKESKSLADSLKEKVAKAKEKIAKTKAKATKKGGARSVAKAKEIAKSLRSSQKKQSTNDNDIESDAKRYAINKTKRTSHGGRANQYGTKAENKGGTYYEKRENRYDRQNKRYAKLESGGETYRFRLKEGYYFVGEPFESGSMWSQRYAYISNEHAWVQINEMYAKTLSELIEKKQKKSWNTISMQDFMKHQDYRSSLLPKKDIHEDYGMMAKGGVTIYNLKKGDKVKTRKGDVETIERKIDSGYYTIESEYSHPFESLEFVSRPSKMADGGTTMVGGTEYSSTDLSGMFEHGGRTRFETKNGMMADGGAVTTIGGTQFVDTDLSGMFEHGGGVAEGNLEMVKNQAIQIDHHAKELKDALKSNPRVDGWVVSLMDRATSNLSDVTHYLEGQVKSFKEGGSIPNNYKGRTTEDIWNSLTDNQRIHFLIDHFEEMNLNNQSLLATSEKKWNELTDDVQMAFKGHTLMGQYAKGGLTEHGLMVGDTIIDKSSTNPNSIQVMNDGHFALVNLDKGDRTEGVYADGGVLNRELNLYAKKRAESLGITPQELKSDYELSLKQSLIAGLTDANYHSEAKKLVSIFENEEWSESLWSSIYWDADGNVRELGLNIAKDSDYDGFDVANAYKYIAQMNGLQRFAGNIDKAMNDDKMAKGGKLIGDQKKLDLNKNGRLDSEDFKMLRGEKMAKGGMQGYDDREDERLGMKHGKISKKDFVGSHEQKEHSRRDDARFEERMENGGGVKYPTDLKVGSILQGVGFPMLKGLDGGNYYTIVEMDNYSATLVKSDNKGNKKSVKKIRHKLDSIEGAIKTAKRGDENGILVVKYAKGGKTKFNDKVKSIAKKLLEKKKVPKKVQNDYGKTFNKKEAVDSAKRIAGSMRKKEMAKKKR